MSPLQPLPKLDCSYENPRDLAVVIDRSASVGESAFIMAVDTLADFLAYMCNDFQCDGPKTRLAVITYGTTVTEVFNFNYSARNHRSQKQMTDDIKAMTTYKSKFAGATATGTALEYCRDNIFQPSMGMRTNSIRQILLLTDGRANKGRCPGVVANQLFYSRWNIAVYALGIGDNVDIAELRSITMERSENNMLHFALFSNYFEFSNISEVVRIDIQRRHGVECKEAAKIFDKKK